MVTYLLLRIEEDDEADALLRDLAANPHLPLTAPDSRLLVHVEVVAEVDASDVPAFEPGGRSLSPDPGLALVAAVRESYHRSGELAAETVGGAA